MPFRIIRNDITRMDTDAVVNTANAGVTVGDGCDRAVYDAAGYDELLAYRRAKIGCVPEGEVFITPGFRLKAGYIIHAVSPLYCGGDRGEEEKLRSCYRKSLQLAKEKHLRSIAFPLISTGSFGYPKEEGMRIAVDEISAFLLNHEMSVFLVVFDDRSTSLGRRISSRLEEYIDKNHVEEQSGKEYISGSLQRRIRTRPYGNDAYGRDRTRDGAEPADEEEGSPLLLFGEKDEGRLSERMRHTSDTFSQYLMYLIGEKKMGNAEVYKRAIVDKKTFSKIRNHADYHPQKLTALCLCIGAKLDMDESRDLLARAGYALSPCDKTDIIFSYFIENRIYDMIELDIQLEEHGLPCIIT